MVRNLLRFISRYQIPAVYLASYAAELLEVLATVGVAAATYTDWEAVSAVVGFRVQFWL